MNEAEIQAAVQTALDETIEARVENIKREMPRFLAEWRAFRAGYEQRLYERWAPALDLYETIVAVAQETGAAFNQQHRPRAAEEQDYVFDVLTRLHARACLIASEVGALMRGGYATGALARQRTLHELAIVAAVIGQHGQDIAERYLLHGEIEAAKAAKEFQDNCARLGQEPFTPEELRQIYHRRDALSGCWASVESDVSRPGHTDVLSSSGNRSQRRPSWIGKPSAPRKRR